MTWTREQQQVIDLRDRNILVSAAAGSGKTAVLVERIVQRVLDEEHPVDIDRMLIVTFTKAAAAEMRERVGQAIEARMEAEPDNEYLLRQYTLVHNAQITTIDSFCLFVVRNYFQTIGLEPGFRIGDPGELKLLQADVLSEVFEEHYQEKSEDFLRLADRYATAKSDAKLVDMVQRLYDFSQSYPWPGEWLNSLAAPYRITDVDGMEAQEWMKGLMRFLISVAADLQKLMERALMLCRDGDGPAMYEEAVLSDIEMLAGLSECDTYRAYAVCLGSISYKKLGVNRKYEGSVEKQELVKSMRATMKNTLKKLSEHFFYEKEETFLEDMENILPDVEALSRLALDFAAAYAAAKQEKNMLDFSDIEHFALNILIEEKTKQVTPAAQELRELYDEIMIDEYQDSNFVQETILKAVSREALGRNNIFMVGDVKQSIYRFRLARPQLFMEKYRTYSDGDSERQKIDLHKNFRSRREVIDSVNRIFFHIMHADLGNVEYDGQAALYAGADYYPQPEQADSFQSELLLAFASDEELAGAEFADWREFEAGMVAGRIKELVGAQPVTDRDTGKLRTARYRDIVILLRSMGGWADTFAKALAREGIPAHTTSQTGYFSALEIRTILSMLSVIDNPLQDIPLAAVLHSPIGGFDGAELSLIRTGSREHFLYLALEDYAQYGEREPLKKKAEAFLEMLGSLREKSAYTPIHGLIQDMLRTTGYGAYIQALPAGAKRKANVDMLLEKAVAYERTSYKGLFHFVRYIEKLKKYEVDFGEADITSENEDVVRIMSIHKSKGLEFPIVFVSGMGKQFNRQDVRSSMILHPEYGIGLDSIDAERRVRKPGFLKKVLENQTGIENQGEEMRILYVALTRAKEKLIMTGYVKDKLPETPEEERDGQAMDYFSRYSADCYLDWVYPSAVSDRMLYDTRVYGCSDLMLSGAAQEAVNRLEYRGVRNLYRMADRDLCGQIDGKLSWKYAYEKDTGLKTKISVSELKHRNMVLEEDEPPAEELFPTEKSITVPAFLRGSDSEPENRGALRGSAVHKVMEDVDFVQSLQSGDRAADLRGQMQLMLKQRHLTPEMAELVNPDMVAAFLDSPLAERMARAQMRGDLYKEQPFVMGIPACEVYDDASSELVLIQGIVDVYWTEPDGITILDYKTDSVRTGEQLVKRYKTQLDLYGEALEKATGLAVREKILYSFHLKEAVYV